MPNANLIDRIGKRYNALLVVKYYGIKQKKHAWVCICDCGKEVVLDGSELMNKSRKSCGCLKKILCREKSLTHGMSKSVEYKTWHGMIKRCYNPKYNCYDRYGGRGINVSDEWRNSFETFFNDMGFRPGDKYSLERKENDKGYSKSNCKWATIKEQANNKERVILENFKGQILNRTEISKRIGISYNYLMKRIRLGESVEQISNSFL